MTKTNEEILAEMIPIFEDVFDVENLQLTMETTAADVDEWDSLAHIRLVLALSKHFGVKFTTEEVVSWSNVSSTVASIRKHLENQ